jgi:hypothetical protein
LPDVGQGMMCGKGRYNSCVTRMLDCGGLVVNASRVLLRVETPVHYVFFKTSFNKDTHTHTHTHKSQLEAFPFKGIYAAPTTRWQVGPASALVGRPDRHRERFITDSPLIAQQLASRPRNRRVLPDMSRGREIERERKRWVLRYEQLFENDKRKQIRSR